MRYLPRKAFLAYKAPRMQMWEDTAGLINMMLKPFNDF